MAWAVLIDEDFAAELAQFDVQVRMELRAMTILLSEFGPNLGRPRVDTLKGSRHANLKELRFEAADGVWGWPSLLILFAPLSCSWQETNPVYQRSAFTRSS